MNNENKPCTSSYCLAEIDRAVEEIEKIKYEVHDLTSNTIPELKIAVAELKGQIANLNKAIDYFVTHSQFYPVKLIAYGLAGGVLTSVLVAVLAKVIIK